MLYATFWLRDSVYLNLYVMSEYKDRDGGDNLSLRIEDRDNVDNFCEWRVPDVACFKSFGFSETDLFKIEDYLNHKLILKADDEYEVIEVPEEDDSESDSQ